MYPQELILKIKHGPAKLHSLHILSHEYKITTRVDVYLGISKLPTYALSPSECLFSLLGYVFLPLSCFSIGFF